MKLFRFAVPLVLVFLISISSSAQSGPGGYEDTSGSSDLVLWLRGDVGVLNGSSNPAANGEGVSTWQDQSGYGYNAIAAATSPLYSTSGIGGMPSITFAGGATEFLFIEDDADEAPQLDNTSAISIFYVFNQSTISGLNTHLSKRDGNGVQQSYLAFENGALNSRINANNDGGQTVAASTDYINAITYQNGDFDHFLNQVSGGGVTGGTSTIPNNDSDFHIGTLNSGDTRNMDGDISEIIVFRRFLTNAERIAVETYLASKYGISLTNDFWDETTYASYDNEIAGIGQHTDGTIANEATSGILTVSGGDGRANGEWLFSGHDTGDIATWVGAEVPGTEQRLAREWVVNETGDLGNVTFTINNSDLPATGFSIPNYYLLVDSDGDADFSDATAHLMTPNGSGASVSVDVANGNHIAIAFEGGSESQIWYSYLSGNWNDPNTWTLDGAISPLYNNPSSEVPSVGDSVVIQTGRTVTMDVNDVGVTRLEIIGTLDLAATTGHTFGVLDGSGTMRLSGAAGFENYPTTNDALFVDSDEGGTLEYYGSGLSVNNSRSANNLNINLNTPTDVITILSNLTVNGNLTVGNGIFQINDNSATTNLTIDLMGDLLVLASGSIDVGSANARHEFNFNGDFTNQGDIDFTNRASQITGSEATDGIVDANFVSGTQDQTIDLQGPADFYRIEVNKGVDQTYILSIDADDPSYFDLFGFASQQINGPADGTTNDNALGLIMGTVKIGNNVTVSPLNTNSIHTIYEGSRLWIDGGTVDKNVGNNSIVIYGTIQVSSGSFESTTAGFTLRDNGLVQMEGGSLTTTIFRTSTVGGSALGGLLMSGGVLNVVGGGSDFGYYSFSMTNTGNVFNVSGGTINVSNVNGNGGVFINSSVDNYNVTGGTVNLDVTNGNTMSITSSAPFFNLNILESSASAGTAEISPNGTSNGGGVSPVPNVLTILNDLRIDNSGGNGTTFNTNGVDVSVTGSLIIDNGSNVDFSGSNLIFEGFGSSAFDIGLASTLILDSLEINKTNELVPVNITNGQSTAIQVDDYLNVASGNLNLNTFDLTVNGNISVSDTIGTATSTGQILMSGASSQAITSASGAIYDLEINNANGVSLSGDMGVINVLDLNAGIFNVNTSKLTLNEPIASTGSFSSSLMVQTGGNPTDGGIEFLFNQDETITYPFGISGFYTPLVASIDTTNNDVGYIRVNPVNDKLGTISDGVGVTDFLNYYWKVGYSDFSDLPRINSYTFDYIDNAADDDVTGTETNFQPGYVEDGVDGDGDGDSYTRTAVGSTADVNTTTDVITFTFAATEDTLRAANYTAAEADAFTGSVTVFYSRRSTASGGGGVSSWVDDLAWSNDDVLQHEGPAASSYPGENSSSDVVVMGYGATNLDLSTCNPCTIINTTRHDVQINNTTITVAEVIYDQNPAANALNNIDTRIRVNSNATLNAERVTGRGTMFQNVANTSTFGVINADFNEFNEDPDNGWFFRTTGSGKTIQGTDRFEFPTLRVFGNNDVSFAQAVTARGLVVDNNMDLFIDENFTINGTSRIGLNQGGELIFGSPGGVAVGTNVTFETDSLILTSNNSSAVSVTNAGTDEHTFRVNGGISLAQGLSFDLYNAGTSSAILEAAGSGSDVFQNSDGMPIELYRLVINKGTDTTNVFQIDTDLDIMGVNTTSPQSIELQNGKLILNNAGLNLELADNSDFDIPSTAGLEVTQGTVTSTGANVILDGLLRVNGGTVNLGTTDIEYSVSGSALLNVSSGTLNVGGQVRRSTTSTIGVLKYRQTGGDVDIATDGASTSSRSAFEILNAGSEFTLTGGTFNIERGVTGDSNLSLELDPTTSDLTGSEIRIYENLGSNYGANFFNISSTIPLNNLTFANTIDLPDARLFNQSFEVNDLTVNTNQAFINNGFNLTMTGDFTNNGTYTNTSAETIFSSSGAQSITGAGTFSIFTLRKNGSGITTSSVSLNLDNDFYLTGGTFDVGSNSLSLQNDAFVQSTFLNSGGNGLVFNGVANQDLNGLTNNAVNIGTITISNPSGVDIPDGNGYDFNITQELRLNGGVFNIGGSLVTLEAGAPVTEVSTFNVNNMVQTNSSFTDNGLRIEFFTVAADTVVFFPIGELKYTPVQFDFNAGTTAGGVRVRPANERHPTIIDDTEPMTETEIDDLQNVLNYHWIVVAENLTNANGSAVFFYDHDDIGVTAPYDTTNYISARLLSNDVNWDKFAPTLFRGANLSFEIPLSSFSATEITGDYTAGVGSSDGVNNDIEGAIPDQLAQYETSFVGAGNYSTAINWNPLSGSPAVTDGVGPVGAQIIVRNGDDLTLDLNDIRLYSTEIEAGGILRVPSGRTGVRLGTVTGSGTIVLEDNELLPTGEYTDFFACDGGALQYSGSTTYSVLSGISQIRKVVFEGTGIRTLPNNLITVCDTLEVNGPTIAFSSGLNYVIGDADSDRFEIQAGAVTVTNGSTLDVVGDFIMSGGTLTGETNTNVSITDDLNFTAGTINWNGTDITLDGTSEQLIDGAFTGSAAFDDLTINNTGTGMTINSGDVEVEGVLTLTDGLVNTTSTETITLTSTGSWTGASTASYITGPLAKQDIAATSTFEFPVGKSVRYAPVSVVNVGVGGDDWTAEYFTSTNPTYNNATFDTADPGSGFNALGFVESTDRWEVTSVGSNTAQVRATYGAHNAFPGTNIRLVWWDDEAALDGDGADNRWENQGGQIAGDANAGTVTSENTIFFSTRQFAVGYAPESLLPVELLDFTAEAVDNEVKLSWTTVSELNNDYFEILHSTNGVDFESVGRVEGNGTTNELIKYFMTHSDPSLGDNYYQLKQVDFDGTETLYEIVKVYNDFFRASMDITVYPNPATRENISLKISTGDNHTPIQIRIIDQSGKVHYQRVLNGGLSIDERLNPGSTMIPGIYYMIVNQGDQIKRQKIVIR